MESNRKTRTYKIVLWVCNLVLMAVAVAASALYANHVRAEQLESKKADFVSTVESLKSVSQNYLDSERGYVQNWAAYINAQQMTRPEALEFLRQINTNEARYAHIVDMDTMEAWSAYYPAGSEEIDTYRKYQGELMEWEQLQADNLWAMFEGTAAPFTVDRKSVV